MLDPVGKRAVDGDELLPRRPATTRPSILAASPTPTRPAVPSDSRERAKASVVAHWSPVPRRGDHEEP